MKKMYKQPTTNTLNLETGSIMVEYSLGGFINTGSEKIPSGEGGDLP